MLTSRHPQPNAMLKLAEQVEEGFEEKKELERQ